MKGRAGGSDHRPPLISEDDRDTAVRRVQEAYTEGRISHEEMDERLHQVLPARTHSELVSAGTVEDPPRAALRPHPAPGPPVRHFFVPARRR
ncbi:DUF1707 domain-containing protein [Nonomuraea muscovyensis]|uniref:DUF1707 SHOCT-like domain-containing protein n=1 Tax=Nonomuraea muscovyensis TaxID=1124761 RepID=UPI0033CE52E0